MRFKEALSKENILLTEGSIIEIIRRESDFKLHETLLNSTFIFEKDKKEFLTEIYKSYIAIGKNKNLPMIILTPTWRASYKNIQNSEFAGKDINGENFKFLNEIRNQSGEYSGKIFIGGLSGCANDAYDPKTALNEFDSYDYQKYQQEKLALAGVDFLIASTLPEISEAKGIARAMAQTNLDYIISFIIRPNGNLLDGTPLEKAIEIIDSEISPKPLGFMLNCIHPEVLESAMKFVTPEFQKRILGIQANTSKKTPEELDGATELDSEEPEEFARSMNSLMKKKSLKIVGGCCGTNSGHIDCVAGNLLKINL